MKKYIKYLIAALIITSAVLITNPMNIYTLVMLQSLAVHGLLFYILFVIMAFFYKSWINVVGGLISIIIVVSFLWPHFHLGKQEKVNKKGQLSVSHFNVLLFNSDYKSTIKAALKTKADIISFQEVDQTWCDSLKNGLLSHYPYQFELPDENSAFGLTVFSKHPIKNSHYVSFKEKPVVELDITYNNSPIHIIATHTNSPVSYSSFQNRNKILKHLKKRIVALDSPTLLIGDFNVVPWDQNFSQLISTKKVNDSRSSYCGTYPTWSPIGKIPIDYILHSNDFECTSFQVIDGTSSDHLGIHGSYNLNTKQHVAIK